MGPLKGVKVVEFAGIGPGPFCCMLLADMGADVLRIDRAVNVGNDISEPKSNNLLRGRKRIALDLKHPDGVEAALTRALDVRDWQVRQAAEDLLGVDPDSG